MIRPWAWRYRDYVIRCFNEDRPYDQFLTEQIAGDELVDWADPALVNENVIEKLVATGFLRMAPDGTSADPVNRFSDRIEVLSDELDVLSRGLLGLTFNCARCHSHKYDPIPQRDYYRLVAVFKGAYDEYDWLTPQPFGNQWNKAKRRHLDVQTASLRRELDAEQAPVQKEIENLQRQLQQKGLGAKEKKKLQAALNKAKAKLPSAPLIRALWDRGRASPTFIYRRGDENQPGSPVEPGVPSALSSGKTPYEIVSPAHSSPKTGRRLAFARWLTASDHPLTARVFVNRIWQQHFGRGVVESVDNFGALGTKPSHPELLDWLAVEFVEGGWSIKRLHRLLMTSTAWRQQSTIDPASEAAERDPENRLLSRMPMRRLMAEEVRDSVLAVSERLNPMPFGKPDAVDIRGDGLVTSKPTAGHWRRSVYLRQRRKEMPTLFETFDLPQMNPNCTERQDSTVVSQPLYLLNNGMIHDLSDRLAAAVERQAGTSEQRQLQLAFVLTTGRPPTTGQLAIATESLQKLQADWRATAESAADKENVSHKALADFCHALLNSAAFLYVD